jgi:hypothetical protein
MKVSSFAIIEKKQKQKQKLIGSPISPASVEQLSLLLIRLPIQTKTTI